MTVIYRRELGAYFKGLIGYIFAAFLLLISGIFFMAVNLYGGSSSFESLLDAILFIYLLVIPILSMRVIAEERHQRTDQLLYSLPTTMVKVVLGKFLALVTVLAMPLLVLAVYPLILRSYGPVNLLMAYGNLLAFLMLGVTLLSIGMFVSSLTENQIVAAGLCFVVILIDFFLTALSSFVPNTANSSLSALMIAALVVGFIMWLLTRNTVAAAAFTAVIEAALILLFVLKKDMFNGLFAKVMQALCVFYRMQDFTNGIFNLVGILYFIAVTVVFLFLTVQSMEKRRWS